MATTTTTGTSGDDLLLGTSANEVINAGNGDDSVDGGAGNDTLNGGAGSDTLDGGAGSDKVDGGSGNDTLIYNMTENLGAADRYLGGSGQDILELQFTLSQWAAIDVQADIQRYLDFVAARAGGGEIGTPFTFTAFSLTVQQFETLRVLVDGIVIDLDGNDAPIVTTADLAGSVTETVDGQAGDGDPTNVLSTSGVIDFVDFDLEGSHAVSVVPDEAGYLGELTASVTNSAGGDGAGQVTWTFSTDDSELDRLAEGEVITQTYQVIIDDGNGGTAVETVTITIAGSNDATVITSGASASVNENVSTTTVVYDANATDVDAIDVLTYSLEGADAGLFTVDSATGEVRFADSPNAESPQDADHNGVYDVVIRVSDGTTSVTKAVAITINDLDEFDVTTPVDTDAADNEVDENVAVGTVVGVTAFASDADATTNTVTYSLSDDAGGLFQIDPNTGVVTTAAAIDREALGASLNITVLATSADGSTASETFAITINDLNEGPVDTQGPTGVRFELAQNTSPLDAGSALNSGAAMGTFVAVGDPNSTTFTYSLAPGSAAGFTLSNAGLLSVGGANVGAGTYTLQVVATDQAGNASLPTAFNVWVGSTGPQAETFVVSTIGFGLNGNDNLTGSGGADSLVGGQNADTINGAGGRDILVGGANADTFVFTQISDTGLGANGDVIYDFNDGNDTINLSAIDADTSGAGNQTFAIGGANSGTVANSITWHYDAGTNSTIIHADVTGDTTADFEIILLGNIALANADFIA